MRLRHWIATGAGIVFLSCLPGFGLAQDAPATPAAGNGRALPQACVDASITDPGKCRTFLRTQKQGEQQSAQPADTPAAPPAGGQQPAVAAEPTVPPPPANNPPPAATDAGNQPAAAATRPAGRALPQACTDAGITDARKCNTFIRQQAAGGQQQQQVQQQVQQQPQQESQQAPQGGNAPATNAVPGNRPANQAAGRPLPQACTDAGITDRRKCNDFVKTLQTGAQPAVQPQPEQPQQTGNAPAEPATTTEQPAVAGPAGGQAPGGKPIRLARDCVAAGLHTAAECDALHAINAQKGKPTGEAAGSQPAEGNATAAGNPPATADQGPAPVTPAGATPEVTPSKGKPVEAAAEPPAAPALPDITRDLTAQARAYNGAVAALAKAGDNQAAADHARAAIQSLSGRMLALCKTNNLDSLPQCAAQYGIVLAQVPAAGAPAGSEAVVAPVQPVEVINNLPKGVTQTEVAPLLDSAKDQEAGKGPQGPNGGQRPGRPQPIDAAAAAALNAPPPTNDKAAQADIKPTKIVPIDQAKGQVIDPNAAPTQIGVPQNVTIINQTVNNTTTNNTSIQNNNGPGAQVAIGNGRPGNGRPGNGQGGPNGGPNGRPGFPGGPGRGPGGPGFPGGQPNPIGLGLGLILQLGNQTIINSPAQDQLRIANSNRDHTQYEQLPGGNYRETIARPDGTRVVTVYNRNGDIIRRSRFDRSGHEIVLAYFDDRYDNDLLQWRDPGEDLPPLQLHIPARDYVLDADEADQGAVQDFFAQPPVEPVQRLYSIDEVKRSARVRDMVRRLEIGDLTFDTGAATISEDQVGALSTVAGAMLDLLGKNPGETFLIEGHTDAVGSDVSNLVLSDARAATVARILTDFYHIPPENLATQGYGERFLKVQTDGPERINRRVTIRRITPLVTVANQNY